MHVFLYLLKRDRPSSLPSSVFGTEQLELPQQPEPLNISANNKLFDDGTVFTNRTLGCFESLCDSATVVLETGYNVTFLYRTAF